MVRGNGMRLEYFQERAACIQRRIADEEIDVLVVCGAELIYAVSGFWGYGGSDFGRPIILVVPASGECALISPRVELAMARAMTWIRDIRDWVDGVGGEWLPHVRELLRGRQRIGVDGFAASLIVKRLGGDLRDARVIDASAIFEKLRMVKDAEEIAVMREAGLVVVAMAQAALAAIKEGVPEYEVSLAVMAAGTRKAAELFTTEDSRRLLSPMICNLQMLMSGPDTCMANRRPTLRKIRDGDPVHLCFCGMANYKLFKLGFDRSVFVGRVPDHYARIYETACRAQGAAFSTIRPGILAREVHAAAVEVYREAGFEAETRTGHGIGYSFAEEPDLKDDDETPLLQGMTLAIDANITIPGEFGARVGDSIVVTEAGYECLTEFPRDLRVV